MPWFIRIGYWLCVGLFVLGLCIFSLNVFGLFMPLRAPELYEVHTNPLMTPADFFAQDDRLPGETDQEFIYRMQELVANNIVKYWPWHDPSQFSTLHIRIPPWENYLLYLRSFTNRHDYFDYEYCTYEKAVERGLGLCSQKAIFFSAIMNRNGIQSQPMGLSGHVISTVSSANLEPEEWLVDADFGIVAQHTLQEVVEGNELMRPYYEQLDLHPQLIDKLVRVYDKEGNTPYSAYKQFCTIEQKAYRDKWLIPIAFMLPLILIHLARYIRRR